MRKLKTVRVTWVDATGRSPWDTEEEHMAKPMAVIESVGHLLKRGRKTVSIAMSHDIVHGGVADTLHVPRGCIQSIEVLA